MVDLKNNPNNKRLSAKTIQTIHCQQTNAKMDLVIPTVAWNLIALNMSICSKHHMPLTASESTTFQLQPQSTVTHGGMHQLIEQIVTKFNVKCRQIYDELDKSMETILASRKELHLYDQREENSRQIISIETIDAMVVCCSSTCFRD